MAGVRIHTSNDQTSAEAAAGRLRADGIPAEIVRADAGPPYAGAGLSAGYDVLVPAHLSRTARRSLGIVEDEPEAEDRRGYYALVVLAVIALVIFVLGILQRAG